MKKGQKKKNKRGKVYIALIHSPVYNKNKDIVTTSITGFDLHDIARSGLTYGVSRYYVVNPLEAQREFAKRIINCWGEAGSFKFNPTRAEAFRLLKLVSSLDDVLREIKKETGKLPKVIATSAKARNGTRFNQLKLKMKKSQDPYLILFGTGWGLTKEVVGRADIVLEPIVGRTNYRHLSVRSAAAVILDRLFAKR